MKFKSALVGFGSITVFYIAILIYVDSRNHVFSQLINLSSILPKLFAVSLLTYLIRYLRWYWMLCRAGNKKNFVFGGIAYLAGFAFTATPGKIGELIRIRYLAPSGVKASTVIAAFMYERAFDLMVVLLLAVFAIRHWSIFVGALSFVVILLSALVFTAINFSWLDKVAEYLRFARSNKLTYIVTSVKNGLSECRIWLTPLDFLVSILLGILAWGLTSFSFVLLLRYIGISIPMFYSFAIYPLAILVGAASMLPGGVGSTEAVIILLLSICGISLDTAMLAAVTIRLSSIWFSIVCGLICSIILEVLLGKGVGAFLSKHIHVSGGKHVG